MQRDTRDKIKLAFLGGGINSAVGFAHYSAINMDNLFELESGFFSRNKEINRETARKYKIYDDRLYDDLEKLISNEKNCVDAVVVLTPTDQHATQVSQLISEHIPVICEKALAVSTTEVEKVKSILSEKNGFLTVIFNYLGYPMIRELRHLIMAGKLGKITHLQVEMPQEGFARVSQDGSPIVPQEWRLKDRQVSTLALDLGVHLHIIIKYLINESPVSVVAKSESKGNFSSIIDNANCIIEYTNDITCNMWFSKIAFGNRNGLKIRVYGKDGSAEWLQADPEILHLADKKGNRWKLDRGNLEVKISNQSRYTRFKVGHPAGFIEAYANYYQDIADALKEYKKSGKFLSKECFGVDEAYEGIKLFEAVQESNNIRSWKTI